MGGPGAPFHIQLVGKLAQRGPHGPDAAVHRLVFGNKGLGKLVERLGRLRRRLAGSAGRTRRLLGPAHSPGQVDRRRPRLGDHACGLFQTMIKRSPIDFSGKTGGLFAVALRSKTRIPLDRRILIGRQHHRRRSRHTDSRCTAHGQRLHGIHHLAPIRRAHQNQLARQKPLIHEPHRRHSPALLDPNRSRQVFQIQIHVKSFILALSCVLLLCYSDRGRWSGRLFLGRSYHGYFARAAYVLPSSN